MQQYVGKKISLKKYNSMKHFIKSVIMGMVTILIWFLASVEMKSEMKSENIAAVTIENNNENIQKSFLETLTMNYEDIIN